MSATPKHVTTQEKNRLYCGDTLQVLRDYKLSAAASRRIRCTAFAIAGSMFSSCPQQATVAQNHGSAHSGITATLRQPA